jgi:hypothetical protein
MARIFSVIISSLIFCSTAAVAQHAGEKSEQTACAGDVSRHCRKVIDQGDFAVLACLQQNRTKLSAACNRVLVKHGQ